MALRWCVGGGSARAAPGGAKFAVLLAKFAQQLVAQGHLDIAWRLLDTVDETALDNVTIALLEFNFYVVYSECGCKFVWLKETRAIDDQGG